MGCIHLRKHRVPITTGSAQRTTASGSTSSRSSKASTNGSWCRAIRPATAAPAWGGTRFRWRGRTVTTTNSRRSHDGRRIILYQQPRPVCGIIIRRDHFYETARQCLAGYRRSGGRGGCGQQFHAFRSRVRPVASFRIESAHRKVSGADALTTPVESNDTHPAR